MEPRVLSRALVLSVWVAGCSSGFARGRGLLPRFALLRDDVPVPAAREFLRSAGLVPGQVSVLPDASVAEWLARANDELRDGDTLVIVANDWRAALPPLTGVHVIMLTQRATDAACGYVAPLDELVRALDHW